MWLLFDHEVAGWQLVDSDVKEELLNSDNDAINCLGNIPLFKAVTAMRDDSDYMQWFTDGIHWYLCESVRFQNSSLFDKEYNTQIKDGTGYYKATIEELIEHFKIEKKVVIIEITT